jgi:hypothetical protein
MMSQHAMRITSVRTHIYVSAGAMGGDAAYPHPATCGRSDAVSRPAPGLQAHNALPENQEPQRFAQPDPARLVRLWSSLMQHSRLNSSGCHA